MNKKDAVEVGNSQPDALRHLAKIQAGEPRSKPIIHLGMEIKIKIKISPKFIEVILSIIIAIILNS